ncbi:hypothetical protein PUN28_018821 [Cardiocondyla obscurior]|uniref:Uncharacterized protein n=1 Tax=Cardiocondyla obscurior TaxID=286306 RepID=A0AAW2EDK5_9HYME
MELLSRNASSVFPGVFALTDFLPGTFASRDNGASAVPESRSSFPIVRRRRDCATMYSLVVAPFFFFFPFRFGRISPRRGFRRFSLPLPICIRQYSWIRGDQSPNRRQHSSALRERNSTPPVIKTE